ncbi:uncharacterized protein LOC127866538 [Dreissena polymorpha]|uniref:SAND domain-containing protein n=1 Tax=Dreissena polymorpha TaxID=45954 RepID=A0A9D4RDH8_DREPO|nr:uncharacterized protein LOC127866538 [Dreissena polymorpha]KAH3863458.1 hypothetical protein DPMN_026447 [Dreissena polymorpha]
MAKRRSKNKARRVLVRLNRKLNLKDDDCENVDEIKMQNFEFSAGTENIDHDPEVTVRVTENGKIDFNDSVIDTSAEELTENLPVDKKSVKKRKIDKERSPKLHKNGGDGIASDEVLIFPTEIDGETCIDIQCGNNEAYMFLGKLCVGSRGACIQFDSRWLTPNEFQSVSGRETAKDWKRSIRHRGRSLKLLINKGLVTVQPSSPKKTKTDVEVLENKAEKISPKSVDTKLSSVSLGDVKAVKEIPQTAPAAIETQNLSPKKRGRKPKRLRIGAQALLAKKTVSVSPTGCDKPGEVTDAPLAISGAEGDAQDKPETGRDPCSGSIDKRPGSGCPSPAQDARTDEERRLDEFVKSLRLTKTTAQAKRVNAPTLTENEAENQLSNPIAETALGPACSKGRGLLDVDPEMPVLQKEAVVRSPFDCAKNDITVNVDALNATVTPPPTPPSDRIEQKLQVIEEVKLVETFKATLASPSNGLKLKINREKIQKETSIDVKAEIKTLDLSKHNVTGITKDAVTTPESAREVNVKHNIQSLLLQDALQSAKKYKEQLQQNRQSSPVKTTTNCVKPAPVVSVRPNVCVPSPAPVSSAKSNNDAGSRLNGINPVHPWMAGKQGIPEVTPIPPMMMGNQLPSLEDMRKLSAMSFKEFMAVMTSIYGPLPSSFVNKDAAFAALKDLQQKHDMLRVLTKEQQAGETGEPAAASSSALLYPMITQQLLLAMTQQLYSMCNFSGVSAGRNPMSPNRETRTNVQKSDRRSLDDTAYRNVRKGANDRVERSPRADAARPNSLTMAESRRRSDIKPSIPFMTETRVGHMQQSDDSAYRKRKHIEVDASGALDLSIKKPRVETNSLLQTNATAHVDGPLDFSVRRAAHERSHAQSNSIPNTGTLSSAYSHTQAMYEKQMQFQTAHFYPSNGFAKPAAPLVCTCGRSGSDEITLYSVDQVCQLLKSIDGCSVYVKTFQEQGISGRMLPFLTSQHLTRTLGMRVGPALSLLQAVKHKMDQRQLTSTSNPCVACRYSSHIQTQIRS